MERDKFDLLTQDEFFNWLPASTADCGLGSDRYFVKNMTSDSPKKLFSWRLWNWGILPQTEKIYHFV